MNRRSSSVLNWKNRAKLFLIDYKGGKCERCGYSKRIPQAYDFHHIDPSNKEFTISQSFHNIERLKKEVDKCSLLCRTCHAEAHYELNQKKRTEREKVRKQYLESKRCLTCSSDFKPKKHNQKYCSYHCRSLKRRKVVRPTKEILKKDIEKMSWVGMGRKYGVSDNAVRKWAKQYNLL